MSIIGKFNGDNFPSTEAFITGPNGNNLFIGVGQIGAGVDKNWGPLSELPGSNKSNPITSVTLMLLSIKRQFYRSASWEDKLNPWGIK